MGTLLVCGGDQRSVRWAPMDANSLERSYPERGGGTVAETTLISIVDDDKLVRKSIETLINLNPAVRPNGADHQWRKEPPM